MTARAMVAVLAVALLAAPAASGRAQTLRQRIEGAPDGTVRLSFAARPSVCGNGRNISMSHRGAARDGWESACDPGPVRVALDLRRGAVTAARTYVGGRWRPLEGRVTDLGGVSAPEAAGYFLDLLERGGAAHPPPALLSPAVMADSITTWPRLLRIARDPSLARETRKQAVFWVSQDAAEAATEGLAELANRPGEDREVRLQAVFALSQLSDGRGIPALIGLARSNQDPAVRKRAIFWLGQSGDPLALALFEELLTRVSPPPR